MSKIAQRKLTELLAEIQTEKKNLWWQYCHWRLRPHIDFDAFIADRGISEEYRLGRLYFQGDKMIRILLKKRQSEQSIKLYTGGYVSLSKDIV